jgi:hypothetical protein
MPVEGTTILPGNMPPTGGATVTITGGNFGGVDFSYSVTLGSTMCGKQQFVSWTSIKCSEHSGGTGAANTVALYDRLTKVRLPCAFT